MDTMTDGSSEEDDLYTNSANRLKGNFFSLFINRYVT